jgi:hypothetical protein
VAAVLLLAASHMRCMLLRARCYGTRSPLQDLTRIIKIRYWNWMPH